MISRVVKIGKMIGGERAMKIFCTNSSDIKADGSYEEIIHNAGHKTVRDDVRLLLEADALFICIGGKENRRIKEDLNLALDKDIPVAFVLEEEAEIDSGLKIQLAIAKKIPTLKKAESQAGRQDTEKAISDWLTKVDKISGKKKKKKNVKLAACLIAAAIVITAALILIPKFLGSGEKDTSTVTLTKEQQLGIDVAALKDSEKIDLSGKGIKDVSFLADCVKCRELDLSNNEIVDISVIKEMNGLEILNVSGNKITDINALLTLKNLKEVDISNNPVVDYTATTFLDGVRVVQ
ncbi:MAG: leucine-rich repeat domain-containing protein [Lachnospiraceae bacterium]|nr:leucine-rich repeat domain-containing protein [Lachnospiraceae bacterium]